MFGSVRRALLARHSAGVGPVSAKPQMSGFTMKHSESARKDRVKRRARRRGVVIHAKTSMVRAETLALSDPRDLRLSQLADQIWSKGGKHLGSATNITYVPNGNPAVPEVMLCGRSDVGKTALLRALFKSRTPVSKSNQQIRKDAVNYFSVGDVFNIAETPGFGGATVPWSVVLQHLVLIRNFVRCRPSLKMVYFCLDASRGTGLFMRDVDTLKFMQEECPNFTIVLTKGDALSAIDARSREATFFGPQDVKEELLRNGIEHPMISTSAFDMGGIDTLRYDMVAQALHALPTERLSLSEAHKLGDRLFDQLEVSTVRQVHLPITVRDEEMRVWRAELAADEAAAKLAITATPLGGGGGEGVAVEAQAASSLVRSTSANELVVEEQQRRREAFLRVQKTVRNEGLMKFVHMTSPWRNPLIWPPNVVPTKHRRSNIMRSPQDPENPYLLQPQFVAPRLDMVFRAPNISVEHAKKKGMYVQEKQSKYLGTTIPHFPEIVDIKLHPAPWMFLGSRDKYYEQPGGRQLAIRLQRKALEGQVDALANVPSTNADLNQEVAKLEAKRYGAPIAFLRPRGASSSGAQSTQLAAAQQTQGLLDKSQEPSPLTNPL